MKERDQNSGPERWKMGEEELNEGRQKYKVLLIKITKY